MSKEKKLEAAGFELVICIVALYHLSVLTNLSNLMNEV